MGRILLIPSPNLISRQLSPTLQYGLYALQAAGVGHGDEVDVLSFPKELYARTLKSSKELADRIVASVELEHYDAVGLTTICNSFHHSINIASTIKHIAPHIQVWMGGPHASAMPAEVLKSVSAVDAVIVGEGERTIRDILQARRNGQSDISGIAGAYTRTGRFAPRPMIDDLDELPFIDEARNFLDTYSIAGSYKFPDTIPLEGARGCPGRCTYCSTRQFWNARVRRKSNSRLIAEMRRLESRSGVSNFMMIGDNFGTPRARLLDFCEAMKRDAKHLTWNCNIKMNRLQVEDLSLLWAGGCRGIFVGVESASQRTLDRVKKDVLVSHERELILRAVDMGFLIETSFIIGFPWETQHEIDETYRMHCDLLSRGVFRSQVWVLCPLPGTSLLMDFAGTIHMDRVRSRIAMDDIPLDEETSELINDNPRMFVQFGSFESPHVDWMDVSATADAAFQLSNMYFAQRQELVRAAGTQR